MLMITADMFSGRPNPSWILTDDSEICALLKEVSQNREIASDAAPAEAGLGLRGFMIEPLTDEAISDFDLAAGTYVAAGPYAVSPRANEIAERLIALMPKAEAGLEISDAEQPALDESFQSFVRQQIEIGRRTTAVDTEDQPEAAAPETFKVDVTCNIELAVYNPNFWNNNPTILSKNNCYNYASNKRTDTFAQPGRGCGKMYTAITCAEVTRAALCDRLHKRFDCFPPSEAPRYLVALVVAPGPGFIDFHWYRKNKEGFWSHKPGGTKVRNVDNSNKLITDPANCNRGPYTKFCGYFYTCKSQRIK